MSQGFRKPISLLGVCALTIDLSGCQSTAMRGARGGEQRSAPAARLALANSSAPSVASATPAPALVKSECAEASWSRSLVSASNEGVGTALRGVLGLPVSDEPGKAAN